jgi:hypothetical protein
MCACERHSLIHILYLIGGRSHCLENEWRTDCYRRLNDRHERPRKHSASSTSCTVIEKVFEVNVVGDQRKNRNLSFCMYCRSPFKFLPFYYLSFMYLTTAHFRRLHSQARRALLVLPLRRAAKCWFFQASTESLFLPRPTSVVPVVRIKGAKTEKETLKHQTYAAPPCGTLAMHQKNLSHRSLILMPINELVLMRCHVMPTTGQLSGLGIYSMLLEMLGRTYREDGPNSACL